MRIWSIHPKYLDAKGLVALWRESLLAKKVLENKTSGYRNHPQLNRFKRSENPINNIDLYLNYVYVEANKRNYSFDKSEVNLNSKPSIITVTQGQIDYEIEHLKNKLMNRDPKKLKELNSAKIFEAHPIFKVIDGIVEDWEIIP